MRDKDLAAILQNTLEGTLVKIANHLQDMTNSKNLCMAGGVALNCMANSKLRGETDFRHIFIQPASTDAGSSVGGAMWAYTRRWSRSSHVMNNVYLGPDFNDSQIKKFLNENNITHRKLKRKELLKEVSKKIADGKIVGWFQGKMEFGPRALGNRSILANPRDSKMKDMINDKVKHREPFRPFAGTILWKKAKDYFNVDFESPFMLFTFKAKEREIKELPAIFHIDNTSRLQTIRRQQNPLYYDLIKAFSKVSGVPCVLNTSFNVRGEPIVCTPEDAYNCFMKTDIDFLVVGNRIVSKD